MAGARARRGRDGWQSSTPVRLQWAARGSGRPGSQTDDQRVAVVGDGVIGDGDGQGNCLILTRRNGDRGSGLAPAGSGQPAGRRPRDPALKAIWSRSNNHKPHSFRQFPLKQPCLRVPRTSPHPPDFRVSPSPSILTQLVVYGVSSGWIHPNPPQTP